jgi:RimJ/RimL family protein N-acetyltransferase
MDITGRLVRLRAVRVQDATRMAELLADPLVVEHLDQWSRPPYTEDMAMAWLTTDTLATVRWAIETCDDGAYIGNTGLHGIDHLNRHCSFGIWIGPPALWGRGYGTEACMLAVEYAFTQLAMEKVLLEVYAGNQRGRRAYEKAGFTTEGMLRRHHWNGGRLVDVAVMAVFADDQLYTGRLTPPTD